MKGGLQANAPAREAAIWSILVPLGSHQRRKLDLSAAGYRNGYLVRNDRP